jgi:hypothetical protein
MSSINPIISNLIPSERSIPLSKQHTRSSELAQKTLTQQSESFLSSYQLRHSPRTQQQPIAIIAEMFKEKNIERKKTLFHTLPRSFQRNGLNELLETMEPLVEEHEKFCLDLVQGILKSSFSANLKKAKQTIGELLLLQNHFPERLSEISWQNSGEANTQIHVLAREALITLREAHHPERREWAHEKLAGAKQNENNRTACLTPEEVDDDDDDDFFETTTVAHAYEALYSAKIANILIGRDGTLNRYILPLAEETLLLENNNSASDIHIKETLRQFSENARLSQILGEIQNPTPLYHDVIRASLLLDPEQPITPRLARVVVLTAALTRCRQNDLGNCYANATAQLVKESAIERTLRDWGELIQTGSLTRTVDAKPCSFLGTPSLADCLLHESIETTDKNFLEALLAIPQIAYAFDFLEVKRPLLRHLIKDSPTITLEELFRSIQKELNIPEEKFKQALFFIQSMTKMPLLQYWENALAGMLFPPMTSQAKKTCTQKWFLYATLHALRDIAQEAGKNIPALSSLGRDLASLPSPSKKRAIKNLNWQKTTTQKNYKKEHPEQWKERGKIKRQITHILSRAESVVNLNHSRYQPLNKFRLIPTTHSEDDDMWVQLHIEEANTFRPISSEEAFSKYCKVSVKCSHLFF